MISDELILKAVLEVDQAILDMFPDPSECTHDFSSKFEKKMKKIIRKANHFIAYKVMRRVASILIAFILSGTVFLAVNTEARAAVFNWVKESFEGIYAYFFVGEEEEARNSYAPEWLPEGYSLFSQLPSPTGESYIYNKENNEMLQFTYVFGTNSYALATDNDTHEQKFIVEENFNAEIFLAKESEIPNVITWTIEYNKVIFTISGFLNEDELIKMAQSVTVVSAE